MNDKTCPNCGCDLLIIGETYIEYQCRSRVYANKSLNRTEHQKTYACEIIRELKEEKIFNPNHPYVDLVRRLAEVKAVELVRDNFQAFKDEAKELVCQENEK